MRFSLIPMRAEYEIYERTPSTIYYLRPFESKNRTKGAMRIFKKRNRQNTNCHTPLFIYIFKYVYTHQRAIPPIESVRKYSAIQKI